MVVRYDMSPDATVKAYWYRWHRSMKFKAAVLAAGLVPAVFVFSLAAAAAPRTPWIAAVLALGMVALAPILFAAMIRQMSKRGDRVLHIDADGLTTEVRSGHWQEPWTNVREIAATSEHIFILGRGLNSVSIPVRAFADEAEREEFLRRARRYLASASI